MFSVYPFKILPGQQYPEYDQHTKYKIRLHTGPNHRFHKIAFPLNLYFFFFLKKKKLLLDTKWQLAIICFVHLNVKLQNVQIMDQIMVC